MLRTTPEAELEHLPLTSEDGRFCLVWDGRLDNREELRRMLLSQGARLRADTDSELVLQSYLMWGAACADRLLGDFAFAVWDSPRQSLFCIRDPVGARSLYWARTDQFFAFASHEEALLALPGVTAKVYEAGIARYFLYGICLPEDAEANFSRTWYENVRFMLAGQFAQVGAQGDVQLRNYWKPEPGEPAAYASDAECQEAFLDVFGAATRARMRSSGDIAVLMSGGLDTAGIVAMARRELRATPNKHLHAYSVISDDAARCLETQSILSMAGGMGDRFHSVSVPSFSGDAGVGDFLAEAWPYSHPEDNDIWLQAVLCRMASRNGHRVVLQGAHGDLATWTPQRYIAYTMRAGHWLSAWRECRGASRNNTYLRHKSASRLWAENMWTAWAPVGMKTSIHALRVRGATPRLLDLDFARSLGWRPERAPTVDRSAHEFELVQHRHAQTLKSLTYSRSAMPRVAGRCGVEARDPWEDQRVVSFFMRLPVEHRVRHGWTKYLVRSTFHEDLDARVLWRSGKEHLGWEVSAGVLRRTHQQFRDVVADASAPCWKYLDRTAASASYELYLSTNDTEAATDVLNMMSLCTWLRRIT
jgi:asparagine synthase (glutamine-hydrolysing)